MDDIVRQLLKRSAAELDALFGAHDAGPVPDGPADGTAILTPGTALNTPLASLTRLFAWRGKIFDARSGTMHNILPFGVTAVTARVYKAPSWLDSKECIVLDYAQTSLVARRVRDEIRLIAPGIYLGKAYWNRARLMYFALAFTSGRN